VGLLSKGGALLGIYFDIYLCVLCDNNFEEIRKTILEKYPYLKGNADWVLHLNVAMEEQV